ncbi:hypothetical protein ACIP4Y_05395 [Streptomyces sp. NPDC088810]|uniref:hypothetical protein n=1 Tax=Streptomyces sp. NPDC088810 TaxID=3365904 RepID=UPI0037F5EF89
MGAEAGHAEVVQAEQVFADLVGEQPVAGDALVDDPASGQAAAELGGEAVVAARCGGGALGPGVTEGDGDPGALGGADVGADPEVAGRHLLGVAQVLGGQLVAGRGVAEVVGHARVGGRTGVAGQVQGDGEFLACGDGLFGGVADEFSAGWDLGGRGTREGVVIMVSTNAAVAGLVRSRRLTFLRRAE